MKKQKENDLPKAVQEYAQKYYHELRYAGAIGDDRYYNIIEHYHGCPTGFPSMLKENKDGSIEIICGPEVFQIGDELRRIKREMKKAALKNQDSK